MTKIWRRHRGRGPVCLHAGNAASPARDSGPGVSDRTFSTEFSSSHRAYWRHHRHGAITAGGRPSLRLAAPSLRSPPVYCVPTAGDFGACSRGSQPRCGARPTQATASITPSNSSAPSSARGRGGNRLGVRAPA